MRTPTSLFTLSIAVLAAPLVGGLASPAVAATPLTAPIVYTANAGDDDFLRISLDGDDIVLTNTGASRLPASLAGRCTPQAAATGVAARCTTRGVVRLILDLRDGDDIVLAFQLAARFPMHADLGAGDDLLLSGEGTSVIRGGTGGDVIETGDGDDTIIGGPGANLLDGGPGRDLIDASASGADEINFLFGQDGSDRIIGGAELDIIYADGDTDLDPSNDAGRDIIDARGGDDFVDGGGDADVIAGGSGDDEISGDDHIDPETGQPALVTGKDGADVISGGTGNDLLTGGGGRDLISGDSGDDTIETRDGEVDLVTCGLGTDSAQVDRTPADRVDRSCETIGAASATTRSRAVAPVQQDPVQSAAQDIRAESAGARSPERILRVGEAFDRLIDTIAP